MKWTPNIRDACIVGFAFVLLSWEAIFKPWLLHGSPSTVIVPGAFGLLGLPGVLALRRRNGES